MSRSLAGAVLGASFAVGCAATPPPAPVQAAAPQKSEWVSAPATTPANAYPWANVVVTPTDVTFPSGANVLRGVVAKPDGDGPFPAIVWNHGSEPMPQFPKRLAKFWIGHGWAFFIPFRRGHSGSTGTYFGTARSRFSGLDRSEFEVAELDRQADDVTAAATWLRTQKFVDARRIVVGGCSFGGIETVLAAERGGGFVAGLDFAGGAMSWRGNTLLQDRMRIAVRRAKIPLFFIQAENDFNTEPTEVLSQESERAGKPHRAKVYPPNGSDHQAGHAMCVTRADVWGADVMTFLEPFVAP